MRSSVKLSGKPLSQHQVIRHKIAEMSARVDATEAWGEPDLLSGRK